MWHGAGPGDVITPAILTGSEAVQGGTKVLSAGAGAENVSTPALSSGQKHHRHSGSARPSPLSTATHGPRTHDPSVFTVTDRRVSSPPCRAKSSWQQLAS